MDATTFMMPLVSRISSMGFILQDGSKKEDELTERQKERRITKPPTVLEIMGFVAFAPICIVGPFIEYKDYIDFINETGNY